MTQKTIVILNGACGSNVKNVYVKLKPN